MKATGSLLKVSPEPRFPPGQGRARFGSAGGDGEVFRWPTGRAAEVVGCYTHEFWLGTVPPVHEVYFPLYVWSVMKKNSFQLLVLTQKVS